MPKAPAPEPWMLLGEEARPRPRAASAAESLKPLQTRSFPSHVLPSVAFPSPRCCGSISLTRPFPTGNSNPGLKHLRVATLMPQTALSPPRTVSRRRQSIDDEITAGIPALRGADGLSPPQCGSLQGDKASALSPHRALLAGAGGLPLPLPPCPALPGRHGHASGTDPAQARPRLAPPSRGRLRGAPRGRPGCALAPARAASASGEQPGLAAAGGIFFPLPPVYFAGLVPNFAIARLQQRRPRRCCRPAPRRSAPGSGCRGTPPAPTGSSSSGASRQLQLRLPPTPEGRLRCLRGSLRHARWIKERGSPPLATPTPAPALPQPPRPGLVQLPSAGSTSRHSPPQSPVPLPPTKPRVLQLHGPQELWTGSQQPRYPQERGSAQPC